MGDGLNIDVEDGDTEEVANTSSGFVFFFCLPISIWLNLLFCPSTLSSPGVRFRPLTLLPPFAHP